MDKYDIVNWLNYKYDNIHDRDEVLQIMFLKLKDKLINLGLEIKDEKKIKLDFLKYVINNSFI